MQQFFATLQEEQWIHQIKLDKMNSRMGKLQEPSDRLRTTNVSLSHQLLQQPSGGDPSSKTPVSTAKFDAMSNEQKMAPDDIKPSATIRTISAMMETMLEKYSELDKDSKKAVMHHAITSNNRTLQHHLMLLRDDQSKTCSIAKLTKEIIKLAETYKVPKLKFDEQAPKRLFNFQTWIMKLKPILAMFPQTSQVLPVDTVIHYTDPNHVGNRALYMLICSRVDAYFQCVIKEYEPFGDRALELIQKQCAHISKLDKTHFIMRLSLANALRKMKVPQTSSNDSLTEK